MRPACRVFETHGLVCGFYARKQNASRVFFARLCHRLGVCLSVRLSVCPSVRLSVTLVICIKTVQARITKSSLWAAPSSLVYRDKISCHWVQGFPSNEGIEEGYPSKEDIILPLLARIM